MSRLVSYEWSIESLDEHGDIQDSNSYDSYIEATNSAEDSEHFEIALVRRSVDDFNEGRDDGHAYITNGIMPVEFDSGHSIPEKYRKEFSNAQ